MTKRCLFILAIALTMGCTEDSATSKDRPSTGGMAALPPMNGGLNGQQMTAPKPSMAGSSSMMTAGSASPSGGTVQTAGMPTSRPMAGEPMQPTNGGSDALGGMPTIEIPPPAPIPAGLAGQLGGAVCAYLERCNYKILVEALVNEPCTQFIERQFQDQTIDRLQPFIDADSVRYSPNNTTRCLDALSTLACSPDVEQLTEVCMNGFVGTKMIGDECTIDEMCWGESFCNPGDACPGTCEAKRDATEICNDASWCTTGLLCTRGLCQPASALDEECGGGKPTCESGLYCTGENGAAGTCKTFDTDLAGEREQCNIQAGPLCEAGLSCVPNVAGFSLRFRCEARVEEGEECHPGLPEHCQDGFYCDGTDLNRPLAPDIDGRCRILPEEGEDCGDAPVGKVCARNLVCNGGVCSNRIRISDDCAEDGACYSGACVDGQCGHKNLCPSN